MVPVVKSQTISSYGLGGRQVVGGKIPVHQVIEKVVNIVWATVLVVQVVGMLPHIHGEQGHLPGGEGAISVGGFSDL